MNQMKFLLEWMQQHEGQRMAHGEILEHAAAEYLQRYGKRFGDPGKAARDLYALGRVQRTAKGKSQAYWYDSKRDSKKSLDSRPSANASVASWRRFLFRSQSFDRENWLELLDRIESELSKADRIKVRDAVARALSRTSMNP